jgi:tight adherence protein C
VTYLIAVGFALSVGMLVVAVANIKPAHARPSRSRLVELGLKTPFEKDAAARRSRTRDRLGDLFSYLGTRVNQRKENWNPIRMRLIQAGYREASALTIFLGIRVGSAAVLYVYGVLGGAAIELSGPLSMVLGIVGAVSGWVVPNFLLSGKIARRQREIQRALPDAVDLLVICVEAGLGLNQAFQRVAVEIRHMSRLLTLEISQMSMEVRAGTPRDHAMMALAERTGLPDLRSLVTMLIQTERFGTSIAHSLRIHAETIRTKRQQRAEEAAAKTTIKMVFPLALCIFPALFVVVLGPALIQMFQTFSSLGG